MKLTKLLLLAACAAALCGCAGNSAIPIGVPIIYAGTYIGPYTGGGGDNGNMNIKITSLGAITGTVNDTTSGQTTNNATGSIDNNGHIKIQAPFAAGEDDFAGTVTLSGADALVGTVTETGAVSQQVGLNLTRH